MSERSRRRGARVDALLRPAFEAWRRRWRRPMPTRRACARPACASVGVVGNLKFDIAPDPALLALGQRWKARGRAAAASSLAAITREGEEAMLLAAWHARAVAAAAAGRSCRAIRSASTRSPS